MHIHVVSSVSPRSRKGNRVTAVEWARVLRALGHRVTVSQHYRGEPCDLLVALHARASHPAVLAYRRRYPHGPLVVVLTGTDLYGDLPGNAAARESIALAQRLVVLQTEAPRALPAPMRRKARVILQAEQPVPRLPPRARTFDVAVVGHLRKVKDPFLPARAARLLPRGSRVRILHVGGVLEPGLEREARREMARNPRYRWLGELPRWRARRIIARSRLLALPSRSEGGAHVVGEAATSGVPILASAIPGTIGLLGPDYPGYFPVGDARALAELMRRAEAEPRFLTRLEAAVKRRAPRFAPEAERRAWAALLAELGGGRRGRTR